MQALALFLPAFLTVWSAPAGSIPLQDLEPLGASRAMLESDSRPDFLATPARLQVENVPLLKALRDLKANSGVEIAFSPSLLTEGGLVTCACMERTVAEAAQILLQGTSFEFVALGEHMVVRRSRIADTAPLTVGVPRRPTLRLPLRAGGFALAPNRPARQGSITGRVTASGTGEPLSGTQVQVVGTGLGGLADADGRFNIANVPAGDVEIRAQRIGYATATASVTVQANEVAVVNLQLSPQALALEELVVTATGLQRAREVGHATATIRASELVGEMQPIGVEQLLQSQAAGVAVRSNTGSIGTAGDIKIRGAASLSLSNRPLVYIDGARVAGGPVEGGVSGQDYSRMNDLNPNDIENIEIVKGPAASTLYGTEGAGGVIRITTKQGNTGAGNRHDLRVEYGANWDDNTYEPTVWDPRSTFGEAANDTLYQMPFLTTGNPFRTGIEKTVALSTTGNMEGLNYYLAGQWTDREGATHRNSNERYNFRANLSGRPSEKMSFSINNGITNSLVALPHADNSGNGLVAISYIGFPWLMPIEASDPNLPESAPIETCPQNLEQARTTGQPLSELGMTGCGRPGFGGRTQEELQTLATSNHTLRYTGSAEVSYQPNESWTNRVTAGYDYLTDRWNRLTPVDPAMPFGSASLGRIDNRQVRSQNLTLEGSSSYDLDLTENLNSVTTVGFQYFRDYLEQVEARGDIFPSGSPAVNNSVLTSGTDFHNEIKTFGFFFQTQVGLGDRLFVTPAIRFDRNSAFGPELGLKTYPKISTSWIASDERFVPDFFEVLKLRVAWGMSGKQPGSNDALGLFSPTPVIMEGEEVLGVRPNRPGNEELKPETGRELELGFDMSTWEGRLGLEFTAYFQSTEDALVQRPLAASSGFPGSRWENVGEITNRGIEVGLDVTAVRREDVVSDWRLMFSMNENEVTRLDEIINLGSQRHMEGYPFGGYWQRPVFINAAGDVERSEEFEFLGPSLPKWEGALSHTLTVLSGHVSLYGNLSFAGGHLMHNSSASWRCFTVPGDYGGICPDNHERNPDGSYTDEARIKQAASLGSYSSAPWIDEGDWLKLRTLSLSFRLPERWVAPAGARNASIRFITDNVATWTRYSGLDPEIGRHGGLDEARRVEFFTIPPARRFITSVSITF